jgi:HPt (histidine-containing phosphotransfer) domain-containing protein
LDPQQQDAIKQTLDRMWTKFLSQTMERVAILEDAAAAFSADQLSAEQRQAAHAAAHKLAGALGTFGLDRGTELARELEAMYYSENDLTAAHAAQLSSHVAEIRTLIENRK